MNAEQSELFDHRADPVFCPGCGAQLAKPFDDINRSPMLNRPEQICVHQWLTRNHVDIAVQQLRDSDGSDGRATDRNQLLHDLKESIRLAEEAWGTAEFITEAKQFLKGQP